MKFLLALLLSMTGVSQVQAATQGQSHLHGPRTTVYMVDDMARAKAWYTEAFGIAPYFDEAYYNRGLVFLGKADYQNALFNFDTLFNFD